METNRLLARCKLSGSLPLISDRLGSLVRTNSESVLAVKLPANTEWQPARDVAISSSIHTSPDTHIEFVTYGPKGDLLFSLFTLMVGDGTRVTRPLKLIAALVRHPLKFLQSLWPFGWSRRAVVLPGDAEPRQRDRLSCQAEALRQGHHDDDRAGPGKPNPPTSTPATGRPSGSRSEPAASRRA